MKKVKGMLAAIAVLAVIGGAFAFKAKSTYGALVFYTSTTSTSCNIEAVNFSTTVTPASFPKEYHITVAAAPTTCTAVGYLTTKS